MRPVIIHNDRYPGLKPFDKGQSTIFFGREQEKKELYYQICLEKMVVLFGKSGLGKSSLLTAGIMPMLEANGYLPIRLRLNSDNEKYITEPRNNQLINRFIEAFDGRDSLNERKIIDSGNNNRKIWEYVKAANFHKLVTDKNYPILFEYINKKRSTADIKASFDSIPITPVFICDQFEEFFFHPANMQQEFLEQLAEVLHDEPPSRVLDWITKKEPEERTDEEINWCQQPVIKVIFSLRSDRFANMQSLVPFISTVLRNRFELKPLTEEQAGHAIIGPAAKKELSNEYVPPFTYEEEVLKDLKKRLSSETNEIESSQLQIVCNYIEQKVRKQYEEKGNDTPVIVDKSLINLETEFPEILSNFYEVQLAKITNDDDRLKARLMIEDKLVLYGQREAVSKARLNKEYGFSDSLIQELLNTRLIREESTSKGLTYELSHDTLLAPVIQSKEKREGEEKIKKGQEERMKFEEETKKKDEELKERYRQLAMEMQLRKEAEEQKVEVERLSKRLKRNSRIIFLLTTTLLVAGIVIAVIYAKNSEYYQQQAELQRDTANRKLIFFENQKTIYESVKDTSLNKDTAQRVALVNAIYKVDSISEITGQKDTSIYKVLDSVFSKDYETEKEKRKWRKLDNTEKIKEIRKIYKAEKYDDIINLKGANLKNSMEENIITKDNQLTTDQMDNIKIKKN